jgi:hypothetical protein
VLPAAVAAWYAVFAAGLFAYRWVESFCPPHELISGMCMNAGVIRAQRATIVLFVALSAVAVVLAAVITAPERKFEIAWITFAAGSALAIFMAVVGESPAEGAAAVVGGLLTALIITRRKRKSLDVHRSD